jgi:FAD/FMN-containing dehydrogenase/1-acyl-sn-glycerol-3-phosphate acyltransferase
MHRLLPPGVATQWWSPNLSPFWIRVWRPFRKMLERRQHLIHAIEVRGIEHLRGALKARHGVLITPNHFNYTDPFLLGAAADELGTPFYFMTAWQVFATSGWLKRIVLRQHGCFSVDREGADLRAFRQAAAILQNEPNPLVIFPEGEMYHVGERVLPFHEGPAAIALSAAKHSQRTCVIVPCALRYYFLADPTPKLHALMEQLERAFFWRPRADLPLERRLFQLAEGALALKELEYLGHTCSGPASERLASLCDNVLTRLEQRYVIEPQSAGTPQRVTVLRRRALQKLAGLSDDDPQRAQLLQDLDNLFFVVQLFSYPSNYVADRPSLERLAETLDKLEEDILGAPLAAVRAATGAVVVFGKPIHVGAGDRKLAAAELTQLLQERVQELLQTSDVPSMSRREGDRARFEVNDVQSKLNATRVEQVVRPETAEALQAALKQAETQGLAVSIAGGRHAMGGQQFGAGTLLVDMRGLNRVLHFDRENCRIDVEAGIQWPELLEYLHREQAGQVSPVSIRQKQTGIDAVTLGGSLSANAHGRGLRFPPLVSDVESIVLVDAAGRSIPCSRRENAELFSLAIGGYGLFGVITQVKLRLYPRTKVERAVKCIKVADLRAQVEQRIEEGFVYGDCQYSTDLEADSTEHEGVFSCYRPVPDDTPMPEQQRFLSEEDWTRLYGLARFNKRKAFETYAAYYLSTSGQVYWSDLHQMSGGIDYYTQVLERQRGLAPNNSEMITEVYVAWDNLVPFLRAAREQFRAHHVDVTYGTIRFVERDEDTFLAWANERQVCVLCNLNIVHTEAARRKAADDFRRLFDLVVQFGGRYFLTYQRWATRAQVEACYPQFAEFLRLKKRYDPQERFQSDWYRHYRALFADSL